MNRILIFSFLMLALCGCDTVSRWSALRGNREGLRALKAENPSAALEGFAGGLSAAPFEPALHMNLGLTLDLLKRPEDALKSYENAEKFATEQELAFAARFDRGELLGRAKKIEEALAAYQSALELKPESVEVKTNIELLISQGGQSGEQDQQGQGQGQGQDKKDSKDGKGKDPKDPKDQDGQDKKDKPYEQSKKYQPRPFKGDLSESDVKKILGEIRQQEQRIRADFNQREGKERPRDKDW